MQKTKTGERKGQKRKGRRKISRTDAERECMQSWRECLALHLLIAFLDCEILRIYILPNLKRNPVGFLPPTRQTPAGLWNPSRLLVDFAVVEDTCSKERHANKVNGSDLRIGGMELVRPLMGKEPSSKGASREKMGKKFFPTTIFLSATILARLLSYTM